MRIAGIQVRLARGRGARYAGCEESENCGHGWRFAEAPSPAGFLPTASNTSGVPATHGSTACWPACGVRRAKATVEVRLPDLAPPQPPGGNMLGSARRGGRKSGSLTCHFSSCREQYNKASPLFVEIRPNTRLKRACTAESASATRTQQFRGAGAVEHHPSAQSA